LFERAVEVLSAAPFIVVLESASPMERWWGLESWKSPELFSGTDTDVASAAWALGDLVLVRFQASQRADPLLSTPDLQSYLQGLLERLGAALSGRHFDHSFRQRFAFAYAEAAATLDEAPEPLTNSDPEHELLIADGARVALAALTERQSQVLIGRQSETLEILAAELEVSRGTIDNEHRRALIKIKEASPTDDDFREVLETVIEMASR
jgi:hypothetical protein